MYRLKYITDNFIVVFYCDDLVNYSLFELECCLN